MNYDINKIAAVVVIYNPQENLIENIKTYINSVSVLFVVDNSDDEVNRKWLDKIKYNDKIKYVNNEGNSGIAYSLNWVLRECIYDKAWLLTMDQDSTFTDDDCSIFINEALRIKDNSIYAYSAHNIPEKGKQKGKWYEDIYAITSGCLINVDIAISVGMFDEKMFIDEVDYEFCWRCKKKGFKLIKYNDNILKHTIGYSNTSKSIWKNIHFEKPFRYRYITRNVLYEISKHKDKEMLIDRIRYIICIFLKNMLLNIDRKLVVLNMIYGILDYKNNKMGAIKIYRKGE